MRLVNMKFLTVIAGLMTLSACESPLDPSDYPLPPPKAAGDPLVAKGRELFFKETFDGNGRTCGTCHPAENNLTIDPAFIATLPPNDALFVAEFNPALKQNFENPKLMRSFGLILENLDGVDDPARPFTMRGVPHVFAQQFSVFSSQGPRTGWSGDGAPGDGTLRAFAAGAIRQHFTKAFKPKPGIDFREPSIQELDALEAFQKSLGRQEELKLPLPLKNLVAAKGQEIFNSPDQGKCFRCHFNAGANVPPNPDSPRQGNLNFNTGVENLPDQPADLTGELNPADDGFNPKIGAPGDGTFNTPSLVEAADTGPFFHNNSVETIEGAVAFYNGDAFNNSPAGQFLSGGSGRAINLDATQVVAVAAFLRVINALDNIRELNKLLDAVKNNELLAGEHPQDIVKRAVNDIDDAIGVLAGGGLHPEAVERLQKAREFTVEAARFSTKRRLDLARKAIVRINQAKTFIVK
jgi:cytochrome c peroxidase